MGSSPQLKIARIIRKLTFWQMQSGKNIQTMRTISFTATHWRSCSEDGEGLRARSNENFHRGEVGMCLTQHSVESLTKWNWEGDEIIHESIVPSSRPVAGENRKSQYPI